MNEESEVAVCSKKTWRVRNQIEALSIGELRELSNHLDPLILLVLCGKPVE